MPVSCCSITWVTARFGGFRAGARVDAFTPTCGGAMFGYDSTPRPKIASTPESEIRIAITQAKTGWLMK